MLDTWWAGSTAAERLAAPAVAAYARAAWRAAREIDPDAEAARARRARSTGSAAAPPR